MRNNLESLRNITKKTAANRIKIQLRGCVYLVRLMRFERTAHSVGGYCSIQLSYRRISTLYIISHSAIKCNCFL